MPQATKPLLAMLVVLMFAGAAQAQPLVVATEPQASAAPLIIAHERGWFAEEGLDVTILHFHANRTMVMALSEGDIDIGLIGLSADAFAMAASHQLRIVAGVEQLDPAYPRYAWLLNASLTRASPDGPVAGGDSDGLWRLRGGARFGLTEAGATARYLLDRRLGAADGLSFVSEGSYVALAAALSQGRIDAALLPAHLAGDLEATGAAVVTGWAGAAEGPVSLSVLMTTAAQTRLRGDVTRRFLRAYIRGVRAYHDMVLAVDADADGLAGAERTALVQVIAGGARRPVAEVAAALPYIALDGGLDADSLAEQLLWWQDQGVCGREIEVEALVDLAPLEAALAELAAEEAVIAARAAAAAAAEENDDLQATDPTAAGGPEQVSPGQ
ncbi:MAG: ABC transporter substrate-binding protein [Alphaproteobacteria bacterium]